MLGEGFRNGLMSLAICTYKIKYVGWSDQQTKLSIKWSFSLLVVDEMHAVDFALSPTFWRGGRGEVIRGSG